MADRIVGPSWGVIRQRDIAAISKACGARGVQVWAALTTYATGGEGSVWPRQTTLAELCGCDVRTVMRTLQTLTDIGYLTVEPMLDSGRKIGNRYTLVIPDEPDTSVISATPTEVTPMSPTEVTPMSLCKNRPLNKPLSTRATKPKTTKPARGSSVPDYETLRSLMTEKDREEWKDTYGTKAKTELEQFIDHHTAKGTISKSWAASMRTWRRNGYGAPRKPLHDDEETRRRTEHIAAIKARQ